MNEKEHASRLNLGFGCLEQQRTQNAFSLLSYRDSCGRAAVPGFIFRTFSTAARTFLPRIHLTVSTSGSINTQIPSLGGYSCSLRFSAPH